MNTEVVYTTVYNFPNFRQYHIYIIFYLFLKNLAHSIYLKFSPQVMFLNYTYRTVQDKNICTAYIHKMKRMIRFRST
jgi:hypothetical protein